MRTSKQHTFKNIQLQTHTAPALGTQTITAKHQAANESKQSERGAQSRTCSNNYARAPASETAQCKQERLIQTQKHTFKNIQSQTIMAEHHAAQECEQSEQGAQSRNCSNNYARAPESETAECRAPESKAAATVQNGRARMNAGTEFGTPNRKPLDPSPPIPAVDERNE